MPAYDDAALDRAFAALEAQAREAAAALHDEAAVEAFRLEWLGRKQGRLNEISGRWLKAAPPEAKRALGVRFNTLKAVVEQLLESALGAGPSDAALKAEAIDITLPGTRRLTGAEHPITRAMNENKDEDKDTGKHEEKHEEQRGDKSEGKKFPPPMT